MSKKFYFWITHFRSHFRSKKGCWKPKKYFWTPDCDSSQGIRWNIAWALRKSLRLHPRDFPWAQLIFHFIPCLESQYSYRLSLSPKVDAEWRCEGLILVLRQSSCVFRGDQATHSLQWLLHLHELKDGDLLEEYDGLEPRSKLGSQTWNRLVYKCAVFCVGSGQTPPQAHQRGKQ